MTQPSSYTYLGPEGTFTEAALLQVPGAGEARRVPASTVAAALALSLASTGKHVLLCEVEGRQGIARMFDVDPLPYAETRIARGLADGLGAATPVAVALRW